MAGEMDFESALDLNALPCLPGNPQLFDQLVDDAVLTAGAAILVQTMRAHGAKSYLISGGFDFMTGPLLQNVVSMTIMPTTWMKTAARLLGQSANQFWTVTPRPFIWRITARNQLEPKDAATIGDGANDMAMLQAAGMGVAPTANRCCAAPSHCN